MRKCGNSKCLEPVGRSLSLIGWFISQSRGFKVGGLIKVDYEGEEGDRVCSGITLRSLQRWLHRGNAAAASSSFSSSSICSRLPAWSEHLQTGRVLHLQKQRQEMWSGFYLDDWRLCCFDLCWLANLWLLTPSAQRLLMCFHWPGPVFSLIYRFYYFVKAALFFNLVIWGQWKKLKFCQELKQLVD